MVYLVTHIAISLVFAQLLGLLLGWLLWGYVARQRGQEVVTLRERLADVHVAAHRARIGEERQIPLPEAPGVLIEGDMPGAQPLEQSFFLEEEEAAAEPPASAARPLAPDLEVQLKETRIRHLEQQLRELEGVRDRLPLLQADLSDAIAGRRAAEISLQETRNDFEARAGGLLAQIQNFENAAAAWDRIRDEFERDVMARDKELAAVKASLRDLQNSQLPEAAELERGKHASARPGGSLQLAERVAELEQALRSRDASLQEQVTRIEALLWRVAELEPFAPAAAKMEEDLRRQESEISGHMAMHADNAEKLSALQRRIAELQSEREQHAERVSEFQQSLAQRDALLTELEAALQRAAALAEEHSAERAQRAQLSVERQAAEQRAAALNTALSEKDAEVHGLLSAQGELHRELQDWKERATQLQTVANRVAHLEGRLKEREAALSGMLAAQGQRLAQCEAEARSQLNELAERHQTELTRLKVNSAQRVRRLRRSVTSFKA